MDQLLKMGFPQELAAQALAATGGKSTLRATEWILNQKTTGSSSSSNPQTRPNNQARVDRYFHGLPRDEIRTPDPSQQAPDEEQDNNSSPPRTIAEEKTSPTEETNNNAIDSSATAAEGEPLFKRPKPNWGNWKWGKHPVPAMAAQSCGSVPLSDRMRPSSMDDVVGQEHLLSKNCILRSALECDRLPSLIFWGPPGTGKTSIARAIASSATSSYRFVSLSAVTAGLKEVREAVEEAKRLKKSFNRQQQQHQQQQQQQQPLRTVLFIDEVHRFNKSQQDAFLPVIEDGSIVFMGATTENPSFHLITPLLSRCRVLTLNKLQPHHIAKLLERAVADNEKGLLLSLRGINGRTPMSNFTLLGVNVEEEAMNFLSFSSDGDARVALNALEIAATTAAARRLDCHPKTCNFSERDEASSSLAAPFKIFEGGREVIAYTPSLKVDYGNNIPENSDIGGVLGATPSTPSIFVTITLGDAKEALQFKHLAYDKAGEEHYNLISALHKSMRGSDPDAGIYWLARMLEGGEEPLYIARRLVRFASEDVGLADPMALQQAVACYQACHFLGMPECNVNLAQCVAYLALAPKSVAVYKAIEAAQRMVRESGSNDVVPLHLRNSPTKLMKELGYGKGYIYPPDHASSNAPRQDYLPPGLTSYKFLNWPPSSLPSDEKLSPKQQQ